MYTHAGDSYKIICFEADDVVRKVPTSPAFLAVRSVSYGIILRNLVLYTSVIFSIFDDN